MVFEPFVAPRLNLVNRLVVPPMATFSGREDGEVHPDELAFLRRRSLGGFGLIVTGACFVHPSGRAFDGQWGCESDARIGSLRAMADAIHEGSARAYLQIHHGGRLCSRKLTGDAPWAPSVFPPAKAGADPSLEMTAAQIDEVVRAFANAAGRAEEAGYDGIELHGANGYLVQQFVSPQTNQRKDEWGADPFRFALAIVDAVLAKVGAGFGVGYRLSPDEAETPGLRMSDTLKLIDHLCQRPLSYLHLSTWDHFQGSQSGEFEGASLEVVAQRVAGRLPLIGVGGVRTLDDAKSVLAQGADLVALGRESIVEPEWPQKAAIGEELRLKFPREGAAEKLTVPHGLVRRMLNVPGWADVE